MLENIKNKDSDFDFEESRKKSAAEKGLPEDATWYNTVGISSRLAAMSL